MPVARTWTEDADAMILKMRGNGQTWAIIGRTLGLSRNTVIERGRRLHAIAPAKPVQMQEQRSVSDDPNRAPLEAGHPLTWGLITNEEFPKPYNERDGQRFAAQQSH